MANQSKNEVIDHGAMDPNKRNSPIVSSDTEEWHEKEVKPLTDLSCDFNNVRYRWGDVIRAEGVRLKCVRLSPSQSAWKRLHTD